MQDRVIIGNGKANNIKFNLAGINSWEQFVAANAAGTLQADVTYNNDGTGTSVLGTVLNKANLMTDATAQALGLAGADADTINDALASIGETLSLHGDAFITRDYSATTSIAANSAGTWTAGDFGLTWPDGYTPVALTKIAIPTSSYIRLRVYNAQATGTGGVVGAFNYHPSSAYNSARCDITVLFIKTALIGS